MRTPKEVLEYYKSKGLPENFCPVPFSTLLFEANGNVCTCRLKGADDAIGDIKTQTLQEIWNGERMQTIRKEFLEGKPKYCAKETSRDKCNLASDNAVLLEHIDLKPIQSKPPIRISPNFNGKCNLECKMCHIWTWPNGIYDQVGFWGTLENEILPHLVEIDTFSGEPFIQKDTYRLMDLAYKINPNIIWSFTSNVNWNLTDTIKEKLDRLQTKTFNVSIDSLDFDTYAEIRRKGDLNQALKTFHDLVDYDRSRVKRGMTSLGLVIHVVVQKDNWHEIPKFLELRRQTGVKLHLNYLFLPSDLSLAKFSQSEKQQVLDYYLENIRSDELKMIVKIVRPLLESMSPMDRAQFITQYQSQAVL